jgi:integrase
LPTALAILDKYKNNPVANNANKLLPVLSNQKMNAYLKEIATICKIEKNFSTHLARHTFATTVTLTNGVSLETVSKMLGHKSIKTTQHYAKIVDRKVSDDMMILKQKYSISPVELIQEKVVNYFSPYILFLQQLCCFKLLIIIINIST